MLKTYQNIIFLHQWQNQLEWSWHHYCPTETMWSKILIEPLQEAKVQDIRTHMMNFPIDYNVCIILIHNSSAALIEDVTSTFPIQWYIGTNNLHSAHSTQDGQTENKGLDWAVCATHLLSITSRENSNNEEQCFKKPLIVMFKLKIFCSITPARSVFFNTLLENLLVAK